MKGFIFAVYRFYTMRFVLLFAVAIVSLSSCVTNRKYVYFQKDDVNKKSITKDTVLRTYSQTLFNYTIQPNDALFIDFKSVTGKVYDFLTTAEGNNTSGGNQLISVYSELVDPDGFISFPVLGKVAVGGKTIFETQEYLQNLANQYLEFAVVKVRLVNFRFTLMGEVKAEGTITTFNNRVTLPEALGLGGGLTDLADRSNIKLIRQVNGQTNVVYVNMLDENFLSSPYYFVNQTDIIVVPPLRQRPFRKYFSQNFALVVSSATLFLLALNLSN
jgi:polysaccharide biosynthesis/export protein